jgi:uncharacterized protein DUF5309
MATQNLDSADLKAVAAGGLIREDVMNKIWDISNFPLPLTDMIGTETISQEYHEWTTDQLAAPNLNNKVVDGADQDTVNNTATGARLGNHCQISTKVVQVSERANNSDTIGFARTLAYQISQRQKELRRDVEASSLSGHGSVQDDGSAVAGQSAGIPAFLNTNNNMGATGSVPGFQNGTKLITAITQGTKRGLTETIIRDMCQKIYQLGGNPSVMMSVPSVIRKFSEYCFTSSARIATLMSDTGQSETPSTAKGTVNVFVTDFGVTLELIPNRIMQDVGTQVANALILDPPTLSLGYLIGYQTEPLAKKGLSDIRMMSVDWQVIVHADDANGLIGDIDYTVAVTL